MRNHLIFVAAIAFVLGAAAVRFEQSKETQLVFNLSCVAFSFLNSILRIVRMNHHAFHSILIAMLLCSCSSQKTAPEKQVPSPTKSATDAQSGNGAAVTKNQQDEASFERRKGIVTAGKSYSHVAVTERGVGDYVHFAAIGVKLRQPEGFERSKSFDGFQQPETSSTVMALKFSGPFKEISTGLTEENMKTRGWTWIGREDIKFEEYAGVLIHFQQPAFGNEFLKWSLAFGDDKGTIMVTATFPKALEGKLSAPLKSVVLSTKLDNGSPADPVAALPFTLVASPRLKLTPALTGTLAYTKGGTIPAASPTDPLFVVTPSIGKVTIGNSEQYATRKILQTAHTKGLSIQSTNPITIDGLDGYEVFAEGNDEKSDIPVLVYQAMLFDNDSYILMVGLVGSEVKDDYLSEFKSMARSFRRK
jgi:hypothetical protein